MADDVPVTPVPVPSYGQPAANASGETTSVPPAEAATATTESIPKDVAMTDVAASTEQAPSPAPAASSTNAPSPAPARTGTPLRTNGQENTSRAASQHPDPGFTMPAEAPPHGAPVRQYLNSKVTSTLLEGMKVIAKEQPKDPLRVLGEYLLQRSKELET
ncbi:Dpy-30 motif-domain-containing protein [Biscogniauxia marginata]|nr:Dpy-30 motif-domain-containing protein [Biscogniauxia marginata]